MKRELQIFFTALMFYTRIPCPSWVDHDEHYISLSTRYLPFVGWIVGGVYAGFVILANSICAPLISVILGMIVGVLLTGVFHEDGFADVCDGFGGGWTKENILAIMKDSRVGTYGVIGLILLVALKISVTRELLHVDNTSFLLIIISSHTLSRMMPVIVIAFLRYVRDDKQAKAKPVAKGVGLTSFFIAALFTIIPILLLAWHAGGLILLDIIPVLAITFFLGQYFKKWIGGYTGDCLGAVQQVTEVTFLLGSLILWRFI